VGIRPKAGKGEVRSDKGETGNDLRPKPMLGFFTLHPSHFTLPKLFAAYAPHGDEVCAAAGRGRVK